MKLRSNLIDNIYNVTYKNIFYEQEHSYSCSTLVDDENILKNSVFFSHSFKTDSQQLDCVSTIINLLWPYQIKRRKTSTTTSESCVRNMINT